MLLNYKSRDFGGGPGSLPFGRRALGTAKHRDATPRGVEEQALGLVLGNGARVEQVLAKRVAAVRPCVRVCRSSVQKKMNHVCITQVCM